MRRLGKVLHLSKSGRLVLRSQAKVRLGAKALDQELKGVGTVFDFFGPVDNPYISVRPSARDPSRYVGQFLYEEEGGERKR